MYLSDHLSVWSEIIRDLLCNGIGIRALFSQNMVAEIIELIDPIESSLDNRTKIAAFGDTLKSRTLRMRRSY